MSGYIPSTFMVSEQKVEFQAPVETIEITKPGYRLILDRQSGRVCALHTPGSQANWISNLMTSHFGVPFFKGDQDSELYLDEMQAQLSADETRLACVSPSGLTRVEYAFEEEGFGLQVRLPCLRGPRSGLSLDLNLLDLPTGAPWTDQVMPVVLYTNEAHQFAYFLWHRADNDLLLMAVDGPFAAWRIKYSYAGHLMIGFQVLAQADDVLCPSGESLPAVEQLTIHVAFASSVEDGLRAAARLLGLGIALAPLPGGRSGVRLPLELVGSVDRVDYIAPDGTSTPLDLPGGKGELQLDRPGLHKVCVLSPSGRVHISRFLAHADWHMIYERSCRFYMQYYQHETGAYVRAVSTATLQADRLTYEGVPFGDPLRQKYPNACRNSSRTGEFGGFIAWALLKNMQLFGEQPDYRTSVERYLFDWALNRGHEDRPYPATVCKQPHEFLGRTYSAYHLFNEYHPIQHELFLLGEMIDYYKLTADQDVLGEALKLGQHFIHDHVQPSGCIYTQDFAGDVVHDYTSVDMGVAYLCWMADLLEGSDASNAVLFRSTAGRVADYLVQRGLDFPTEGEPCTDEGSIACAALNVLSAYLFLQPKPEYLEFGRRLLELHEKLMLKGCDVRLNGSSLRFWETQYETEDWGPSINAGHGWTIWTAHAKVLLYRATGESRWLVQAYTSYLNNMSKINTNGGMFPCYTPDIIPGTPHGYPWAQPMGRIQDTQQSSTILGMRYPTSYSVSGLHMLIRGAETWDTLSAWQPEQDVLVNGIVDTRGCFVSAAPHFCQLALSTLPPGGVKIAVTPGQDLLITLDQQPAEILFQQAELIERVPCGFRLHSLGEWIGLETETLKQR